jgi:hypothetical protein
MAKIIIDLKGAKGKYCGECKRCQQYSDGFYCDYFEDNDNYSIELVMENLTAIRCPQCLDAERVVSDIERKLEELENINYGDENVLEIIAEIKNLLYEELENEK